MGGLSFAIQFIHKNLLVVTCEIFSLTLAVPIKPEVAQVVAECWIHRIACIFGLPKFIIIGKYPAFLGEVIPFIL